MKRNDYQLLEEAYTQTRPTPRMVLEAQLQETIEIINEGMWDRLKSDAAGATAGLGRKALGTVGRAATLGLGGNLNPFNKMVASGRQAGQEARAGSLGKSHQAKLQKAITGVTDQFNKAIDAYIADMEKQQLIAPNSVNTQTNELKAQFGKQLQQTQGQVDQLVQTATGMTAAGADGKTVGGMDQQQVGGATVDAPGLGSAINKNIIQPTKKAATDAFDATGKAITGAPETVGGAVRKFGQAPGNLINKLKAGYDGAAQATPGEDATEKAKKTAEALKQQPVSEDADEEDEDDTPKPGSASRLLGYEDEDWAAEDPDQSAMDREEAKGKKVKKENTSPLDIELPYTHLHESNTQSYANNMEQGWRSRRS